ncbi:hypothetical protein HDU79_001108, partial [Rhizoclosmatium sp. JEL0117]
MDNKTRIDGKATGSAFLPLRRIRSDEGRSCLLEEREPALDRREQTLARGTCSSQEVGGSSRD